MIIATLGFVIVVVAVIGAVSLAGRHRVPSTATDLLDERLARGEISPAEHRQRRQVLTELPSRRASPRRVGLLGGVGLLLVVAGVLVAKAISGPGWWTGHPMSMGGHMGGDRTTATLAEPPTPGAAEVAIQAGDMWFDPDRVEIEAGATTNLVLDNTGQVFHDLSIPDLGVRIEADAGEATSTAVRPPEGGVYEFLCTVRGHASAGMRGELVVTGGS